MAISQSKKLNLAVALIKFWKYLATSLKKKSANASKIDLKNSPIFSINLPMKST